jgi:isopentenyl diphosphate isomerase/L-lactate dehydrogenase-like FMN-dependent dehydrogenase
VEAVKGQVVIMVDGGVRTGTDVLKYLALGADCVLVGRPVIIGAVGGYAEGVQLTIDKLTAELKQAMILTGCADLASINETVIF